MAFFSNIRTNPNAENYLNVKIIFKNQKQLEQMFKDMRTDIQNKIVLQGMRKAANIILKQAKINFQAVEKGRSKEAYKTILSSFATEPMKSQFGLKVGIKYYKSRWINFGTADRGYISKGGAFHNTGRIQPSGFFFKAVTERKDQAQQAVSQGIIDSLEKTVQRYSK